MAEIINCPKCKEYINLEIDIYRDGEGIVYCKLCNGRVAEEE